MDSSILPTDKYMCHTSRIAFWHNYDIKNGANKKEF